MPGTAYDFKHNLKVLVQLSYIKFNKTAFSGSQLVTYADTPTVKLTETFSKFLIANMPRMSVHAGN